MTALYALATGTNHGPWTDRRTALRQLAQAKAQHPHRSDLRIIEHSDDDASGEQP